MVMEQEEYDYEQAYYDIDLPQRLKQLGLTGWGLAKICTIQEGQEPNEKNVRRNYSSIKRAIDNPDSISLGLYKTIIMLVGGKLHHVWT
ncbi:hypothetical protein [Nostoc sp. FACHB-133]|uniref:hypothetical protein n=1 Tax=Nostoc sp. FACHB-133 TaxID=2692835 RepID=UPI00168899B5|nr:hypothetical protein [Nostoc sp. FACHB-133]MBD2524099.1 hypothetical protein [Nostoc sp. FACHB-133]